MGYYCQLCQKNHRYGSGSYHAHSLYIDKAKWYKANKCRHTPDDCAKCPDMDCTNREREFNTVR